MICKYFLPFSRLTFHFVDNFHLPCRIFLFSVVPLVYFCFCCLCFWNQIQKIIAKTDVKEFTAMVSSWSFVVLVQVLDSSL